MKRPFFSVVVPVFNREDLIRETIDSIIGQTFNDFEIVIVDDGSTDDSASVIKGIESEKIKYHFIENSERGAARNHGIKKATAEYVVLFDSDDMMDSNHLQVLHNHLKTEKKNFIATKFFWEDEKGNRKYYPELRNLLQGDYDYSLFLNGNFLACNICFKRENPDLIYFQESRSLSIMEDWIFLMQNLKNDSIHIIDHYTIIQRDHSNRSMVMDNKLVVERKLNALKWLQDKYVLNKAESQRLWSHGYYFIALHYYLDSNFRMGVHYLLKSLLKGHRLDYIFILGLKLTVGKRNINKIRGH